MSWRIPSAQIIHDSDFTFPAWDENDFQADPALRGRAAITWKAAIRLIVCLNGLERIFYQWRAGKLQMHRATLAAIIEQLVNAAETNIRVLCALRPSAPPFDSQDPESIIRGLPRDCLQNFNQRSWERWGDSTDPDSCAQKCLKLWRATTQLKQELKRSPAIALKTVLKPGESLTVEKGGGEPGEFTLEIYPRVLELRGQGKKWDFVVKQINREFRTNYKDENLQRQYRRVKNKPKTPR